MKKLLALLLAGLMAVAAAGCSSAPASSGDDSATDSGSSTTSEATGTSNFAGTPDEGMVTVDLRAEPPDLNPITTSDVASADILRMTTAGLMKLDENDQPVKDLAEDYTVSEDGCTYTFKIRQDAKWNNGDPVTAQDFVYSWLLAMDQKTAATYGFILYNNIVNGDKYFAGECKAEDVGVKALDEYTLEVTFNNPLTYALNLFAFQTYLPVNQKIYEAAGTNSEGGSLYNSDPDLMGYNGPYYVESWTHNTEIVLAKNPDYYNADEIKIDKVKYTMMTDTNARMNAFQGGQVDAINLTAEQMDQMKQMNEPIHTYVDNGNWYFQYNLQTKALQSAKVRKALGDAIDPQSYIDNVLRDGSELANGLVPPSINGANNGKYVDGREDLMDHDTAGAKALFDEGLAELNLTADDVKLTYVCDDTSNAQTHAAYFQQQWADVLGIEVEISPMAFQARLDAMRNGNFDIVFAGWSPDYNDAMTYLDMFMKDNGNNYGKYDNPEYDELLTQAMAEQDAAKRQEMLQQAETILVQQDYAVYPLYFSVINYVSSNKISGMTRTGFQEFDFCDGAEIVS